MLFNNEKANGRSENSSIGLCDFSTFKFDLLIFFRFFKLI